MTRLRRSLIALAMSTAVMFSACAGPVEQAQQEARESAPVAKAPNTGMPVMPWVPGPPVGPSPDPNPGGDYGFPRERDCYDTIAC